MPFLSDPNRDPYGISERSGLETAGEDTAHRFGRLALGGRGHMGVGVQGKPRREVPQHSGYRFHVHPVLEGQGGKCVPLRYNNDKQKKPLFSRGLSVCRLLFNSFSKLKIDENYKEKRRLFY